MKEKAESLGLVFPGKINWTSFSTTPGRVYICVYTPFKARETRCPDFWKSKLSFLVYCWGIFWKICVCLFIKCGPSFSWKWFVLSQDVIGWIENVCIIKKHYLNYHGAMTIKHKKPTKSFFWRKKLSQNWVNGTFFYPKLTLINFSVIVFLFVKLHLMVDIRKRAKETGLDF